jgi:L-methionine (R)-S-oxide reductase
MEASDILSKSQNAGYDELNLGVAALIDGERDWVANLANTSALLFYSLPNINWAGFYLLRGDRLLLGPFQGKPACISIPIGKGVCGTVAKTKTPQLVRDVHAFPGHIACDPDSRSEIVIPILSGDELIGVLDIDSAQEGRFGDDDLKGLRKIVDTLIAGTDF